LHPAQKAVIIYANEENAQEYRTIVEKHSKKFIINHIICQSEPWETVLDRIADSESVFLINVDETRREQLLEYCFLHNKRAYIQPTFSGVLINKADISWISNTPMFLPKNPMLDPVQQFFKRCMDITISLPAIILTSWLMLIILIAIRINDRGPAIYKQTRVTKDGNLFTLYKFRSMKPDAEADGVPRLADKDDIRVTTIGRVLRRTRLDELPQFFNVLSGKMSLVGPRPERPEIAKEYEEKYPYFSFRTKIKAGITGYAQIYGKYSTAPDEKLFLVIIYIEKFSIWQDMKLLLQTLRVILIPSSAEGLPKEEEK
jgi:exopolysaccharide biosynthesis polyprenyl glycosylphosphotransferase